VGKSIGKEAQFPVSLWYFMTEPDQK
jgi:hypothetical protein